MTPNTPSIMRRAIATSLLLAGSIAACASPRTSESHPPDVLEASSELVGNPSVEKDLEVVQPRVDASGATKTLAFELHNRASEKVSFAYALVWSDRNDKRVGAPQRRWTLVTLDAGASTSVVAAFPPDGAESWRLMAVHPDEVR